MRSASMLIALTIVELSATDERGGRKAAGLAPPPCSRDCCSSFAASVASVLALRAHDHTYTRDYNSLAYGVPGVRVLALV